MLVGYGSAGQYELDFMVRNPNLQDCEFIVASIQSKEEVEARLNTTIVSAGLMDCYPKIKYVQMDLQNHEQMVKILKEERPDIITYTGRFIPGIKYGHYSYPNEIGYGAWIALAVPLIYNLCKAIKDSGIVTKVINSSFPDGVCPWLRSAGFEQVITGAGNLNHLIPRLKLAIAKKFNCSPLDINDSLYLVGSHYLNTYVSKEGNPKGSGYVMGFTITKDNSEFIYTSTDDNGKLAKELFSMCKIPMESGHTRNLMIASDMANIVDLIVTESDYVVHLPGVDGLIGGYPSFYNKTSGKFEVDGGIVDIQEWIAVNKQSISLDGIEDISDGVVTFTDTVIAKMKEVFDIEYPKTLRIEDAEEFAYKIKDAIMKYEEKKNV